MKSVNRKPIKTYDYDYINQAAEIIRKDPARNFTITELALEVNLNTFKLREGFKFLYGVTIYHFQSQVRLDLARTMLKDTDFPIEEIAYKTGFGCRNSLTRRFRQVYGTSPREWRQELCTEPPPTPPERGGFVVTMQHCRI